MNDKDMARTLGIVSLGIGIAEVAAPERIERLLGVENGSTSGVLRALGVREVFHGMDLLAHRDPLPGVWGRVAGDVLDGALLGAAATRTRRPAALAAVSCLVLGIGALDLLAALRLSRMRRLAARRAALPALRRLVNRWR